VRREAPLLPGRRASANPEIYEFLETEGVSYTTRLPANSMLQSRFGYRLRRAPGRPSHEVRRCHANFSYQAQSWSKPGRALAKVGWHPGELYPRVGFIVTNLARPAELVVAFYNQRGHGGAMDQRRQGRDQVDAAVMPDILVQHRAPSAPRSRVQPRQLHAVAGNAESGGAVVADPPAREADQDRREGRKPRALRHLPDGRGRGIAAHV